MNEIEKNPPSENPGASSGHLPENFGPEKTPGFEDTQKPPQAPDRRTSEERSAPRRNTWIGGMLVGIALLGTVRMVYNFFDRPGAPKDAFAGNFNPPEDFLADYRARLAADSTTAAERCLSGIADAGEACKAERYEAAQEPLLMLVVDTSAACGADAYFYLGLLQLKMDEPDIAIQCFAKVEDFTRYGDDIQWFTALAFVRVAENRADRLPQARRALERVRDSARSEERRAMAEKLLGTLGSPAAD